MRTHTYTETQWAVKFNNDYWYPDGYVSTSCTHPGTGLPVPYDEELARIDASGKDRELLSRTIVHTTTTLDWVTQ